MMIGSIEEKTQLLLQKQQRILNYYQEKFLLKNIHLSTRLQKSFEQHYTRLYIVLGGIDTELHLDCRMVLGQIQYHFYNYATEFYFQNTQLDEVYSLLISHLDLIYYMS
jgi:hypothetical protein